MSQRKIILILLLVAALVFTLSACKAQEEIQTDGRMGQATGEKSIPEQEPGVNPQVEGGQQLTESPLFIDILSVTSPVSPGSLITLFAKTKPNADCAIQVSYKGGAEEAKALVAKQAEGNGLVSWTWTVDPSVAYGSYTITLTAKDGTDDVATTEEILEIKSPEECKK